MSDNEHRRAAFHFKMACRAYQQATDTNNSLATAEAFYKVAADQYAKGMSVLSNDKKEPDFELDGSHGNPA